MAEGAHFRCWAGDDGHHGLVTMSGDLDMYSAPSIRSEVRRLLDGGVRDVILDLSDVHFIDSTALGVILGAISRTKHMQGRTLVVTADDNVTRVFRLTRLDEVVSLFRTLDEAEASLAARAA